MVVKTKTNKNLDVAYIQLKKDKIYSTFEIKPGILLDLNKSGDVVGIEVLSAEKLAPNIQIKKKPKHEVA